MIERFIRIPHRALGDIHKDIVRGHATGVDDAFLNGDLDGLPESLQRIIIASAHDFAAKGLRDSLASRTQDELNIYKASSVKHIVFAIKVFFKTDGKDLREEILEFRRG